MYTIDTNTGSINTDFGGSNNNKIIVQNNVLVDENSFVETASAECYNLDTLIEELKSPLEEPDNLIQDYLPADLIPDLFLMWIQIRIYI